VFASLRNRRGEAFVKTNASELAHLILGDVGMARSYAGAAAVLFRRVGDERHAAVCLVTLASIDRRHGQRRLARRRLRVARRKASASNDSETESMALLNLALVELDLVRPGAALSTIEDAFAAESGQAPTPLTPILHSVKARALAGLERLDDAREQLNQSIATNKPGSCLAHLAAWWNAEVLAAAGDPGAAADQVALAHQLLTKNLEDLPDDAARRAWTEVREHRAIASARELYFVSRTPCRVPRPDAPTGRPLQPDELVDILWTVSHPDDWGVTSQAARRRLRIRRLMTEAAEQGGVARVADVAAALDVSERTIKRDLAQLRSDGLNLPSRRSTGEN
jgi:hypothetical protein